MSPSPPVPAGEPVASADLEVLVDEVGAIIDARRVDVVFQPVVHLPSSEVVGFEAYARGPEGSRLESPVALFRAAELAGRVAELDWVCATTACKAAVAAHLHPSMTVFLNFDPRTLLAPCPDDLFAEARYALDRLRVMVEVKESELTEDPGQLFEALSLAHEVGWGVAIDNAGASPATLALLPLVHPDVLKLDLRDPAGAGGRRDLHALAELADGARAYSEQTGATILVQGIEEPEDLLAASFAGASYGQGWLLGHPGALPSVHGVPRAVFPLLDKPDRSETATPYEIISASCAPTPIEKRYLVPLCHYLEEQVDTSGPAAVLFVCFESSLVLGRATRDRLRRLGERAAFTIAFGSEVSGVLGSGAKGRSRDLAPLDRFGQEWVTALLAPHYAVALAARDLDGPTDGGGGGGRRLDYVLTHDREVVLAVARSFMRELASDRSAVAS